MLTCSRCASGAAAQGRPCGASDGGDGPFYSGAVMSWLILFVAGLLEVVWAIGLKYTEGFSKPVPSLITIVAMIGSFYLLSVAMRSLPLGTAYAVWVGIGVVGAAIAGIAVFQESANLLKVLSLMMVIGGIAGLKLSSAA